MRRGLFEFLLLGSVSSCLGIVSRRSVSAHDVEPALTSLADALRHELLGKGAKTVKPGDAASEEAAARKALQNEAKRLEQDMEPEAKTLADIMRQLADQGEQMEGPGADGTSIQTTITYDENGRQVIQRRVKTCKDGVCHEELETSNDGKTPDVTNVTVDVITVGGNQSDDWEEMSPESRRALQAQIDADTEKFQKEVLKNISQDFEKHMSKNNFSEEDLEDIRVPEEGEEMSPAQKREMEKALKQLVDQMKHELENVSISADNESIQINIPVEATQNFWSRFQDSGISDSADSDESATSETMQSEMVVENGKVLTKTKRCHNGNCQTTAEERDAEEQPEPTRVAKLEPADAAADW
eukprot:gb/GFBE01035964.1/.p1 GENE.gb/GFBE01035964.1/~~gb/GFBE01035964.1/.p1  ORF type:complete len:356 (+),score=113.75 gb/GFBE01035964.1/:1-1068(+)